MGFGGGGGGSIKAGGPLVHPTPRAMPFGVTCYGQSKSVPCIWWGGGGLAQGLGITLFAFGGAYWPLALAHPDPLWVRKKVLVVSTEPPDDLSCLTTPGVGRPGDGLLPVPLTRCIQMHTPSPCGGLPTPALTCARWGVHL